MKNVKSYIIIFITIAALTLSACQFSVIRGSGHVITEKREVSGFDAVSLSGIGDVTLTQGENESLEIETEDNIISHIVTEVKGSTLYIYEDQTASRTSVQPSRPINFNLAIKNLKSFDLSGAGSIHTATLKADSLSISISGAGNITLDKLEANALTTTVSGTGNLDIAGKVAQQNSHMSGLGNYHTPDLQTQSSTIEISGAGNATVWAQNNLAAHISGAGSTFYYGRPQVTQSISGIGSIKSLGNK